MEHPAAQLYRIDQALADLYLQSLMDALEEKKGASRERSMHSDFTADVYDELLTGEEIQYQIDCVNEFSALEAVALAVESRDRRRLMTALAHPVLAIKRVRPEHGTAYFTALRLAINGDRGIELCHLQKLIDQVKEKVFYL